MGYGEHTASRTDQSLHEVGSQEASRGIGFSPLQSCGQILLLLVVDGVVIAKQCLQQLYLQRISKFFMYKIWSPSRNAILITS